MSEEQKMSPEMEKKDGAMDLPETGENMASKSTKPVNQRKTSPLVLGLGGFAVALVVGFLIFYGVSVAQVKNMSRSSFTFKSAAFLHLPVASINGKKVLYTDYIDNIQAMEKFYETDINGEVAPTEDEKSDFILSRLLINNLVADVADDMGVKITKEDIDKIATEQIVAGFPSKEDAEKEIMDRYGWTLAEFLDKIVYPTELEKKLSEKYKIENPTNNTDDEVVRTQALEILKQIQDGVDFAEMAQQYGSDGTATEGGDLGWFGRGMMVPEFEEVVFSLDKGELYSDVVKTQYGYHILQVTDKRTTTDEDANEVEEVQARHILFPFQENTDDAFRTFMNDKLKNADIKIIADIHNPFEGVFDTESTSTQE
ncbi:MAG: hypothetical protein A2493_00565 [Candidatus Magasanikbacteria bacterium RIFOXYC12_FULL_33_11]|uniref:PpiC domain-containing protein n=1 Tax=Candidatus Magasanikbacteria bacterium RIFOXYC12_FULL_33_11 TaxID=1798701 RepID=A0A1F6NMC1_9BACT|nr:MAG: hypothetical protein A2493_00565 [Candidatus Magasanikbacteria bacterium RIFOXYC12_FULL_33_11]